MAAMVSLKTIAKEAGVSPTTVSMILNDRKTYCSMQTCQRVKEIAAKLGYRTNFGYQLIQNQTTRTSAIMNSMPQMEQEEHIQKLTMQLVGLLNTQGYFSYCGNFGRDSEQNLDLVRNLINRGVERFIMLGNPFGNEKIYKELEQRNIAVVCCGENKGSVSNGSKIGSCKIFEYLRRKCGENFRLMCPHKSVSYGNGRLMALCQTFPNYSFDEVVEKLVFQTEDIPFDIHDYRSFALPNGYDGTEKLLAQLPNIGGICYMNDSFAIGGGKYILYSGKEEWKRIILAGNNNDFATSVFPLPIISVEFNLVQQAQLLVQHVLNPGEEQVDVPPIMHWRRWSEQPIQNYPEWVDDSDNI